MKPWMLIGPPRAGAGAASRPRRVGAEAGGSTRLGGSPVRGAAPWPIGPRHPRGRLSTPRPRPEGGAAGGGTGAAAAPPLVIRRPIVHAPAAARRRRRWRREVAALLRRRLRRRPDAGAAAAPCACAGGPTPARRPRSCACAGGRGGAPRRGRCRRAPGRRTRRPTGPRSSAAAAPRRPRPARGRRRRVDAPRGDGGRRRRVAPRAAARPWAGLQAQAAAVEGAAVHGDAALARGVDGRERDEQRARVRAAHETLRVEDAAEALALAAELRLDGRVPFRRLCGVEDVRYEGLGAVRGRAVVAGLDDVRGRQLLAPGLGRGRGELALRPRRLLLGLGRAARLRELGLAHGDRVATEAALVDVHVVQHGDGVGGDVAVALRLEDHERVALRDTARVSVNLDFFYLAGLLADVLDLNVADARRQALDVDGGGFEAVVHGLLCSSPRSSRQQRAAVVVDGWTGQLFAQMCFTLRQSSS